MKKIVLASLMMACLPFVALAQSADDDLYFIPKKKSEKKEEVKEVRTVAPQKQTTTNVYATPGSTVVVKDVKGRTRDVDEYNRRFTSRDNTFSMDNDTLYIEEKPLNERGEWVNDFQGSQDDYEYAMRIVRFRNPRYAIPVSSPLYWDVVYGAYPSWDWNVYDDGMYAYAFPTFSNRLWWDWRWNYPYWSNWNFSFGGWGSSWYGGYYPGYWGGYYGGGYYGGGYWGGGYWGGHHHHYPSYGWGGGGHGRPYRNDIPSGRYQSSRYDRNMSAGRYNDSGRSRYTTRPSRGENGNYSGSSVRPGSGSSAARYDQTGRVRSSSSVGRVVDSSSSGNSIRPGMSTPGSSGERITNRTEAIRSASGYTRPSMGTGSRSEGGRTGSSGYTRPNNYGSGSTYSRPSSTRSTYQRSNSESSNSSRSSYNSGSSSRSSYSSGSSSGGGGTSRSSGGGAGGGRRR